MGIIHKQNFQKKRNPMKNFQMKELSKEIFDFLEQYANISPNYDPNYDSYCERFTSPDASELYAFADYLDSGNIPNFVPNSAWVSCGYGRYSDEIGRKKHDDIMVKIKQIVFNGLD